MIRIVIGIEGPVLAGKTTVIKALCNRLSSRGINSLAVPCFVEAALSLGLELPPAIPRTPQEELDAVRFFLSVDRRRRPPFPQGVVFLDRTLWTLVAHNFALARTRRIDAVKQVQNYLESSSIADLRPSHLIYLDVSHEQQLARARRQAPLPEPFLDLEFNVEFRAFFKAAIAEQDVRWVNADEKENDVVNEVDRLLSEFVKTAL